VWVEGLAQMHVAARRVGDASGAAAMSASIGAVQRGAPNADAQGLVAACTELETGFGWAYFNSLAVAPTAWAGLASVGVDPFWFDDATAGLGAHPLAGLPTVRLTVPSGARFTCSGRQPCLFTVTGTSTGVVGTDREIYLLVEPTAPVATGRFFTQTAAATVASDGTWSVTGQLGDASTRVDPGDAMRLVALVVDGDAPAPTLAVVTPDTVPSVQTTSGLLDATVE
jgi:hypothetical protein